MGFLADFPMSITSANSTVHFWKALISETKSGLELTFIDGHIFKRKFYFEDTGDLGVISKKSLLNYKQTEPFKTIES